MPSKQYFEFIKVLMDCDLLFPGEVEILAKTNRNRTREPRWYAVIDVCATRAAHKRNEHTL